MHSQLPAQGDHKETRLDEDVQLDWAKGQVEGFWGPRELIGNAAQW